METGASKSFDPEWWITCSADGMTIVDPGLAAALGYKPEELIGRRIDDPALVHPEDLKQTQKVLAGLCTMQWWNMRMRMRGGGWLKLQWSACRWTPYQPTLSMMLCAPA